MLNITQPTLLLDKTKCLANIRRMVQKARQHGLQLIPHVKTHQSAQVGEWFRQEGVTAITVSSLAMAEYFAQAGWRDITVAFPVNVRAAEAINRLAGKVALTIFVTSPEAVTQLAPQLSHTVKFYVEIDAGYGRSGVPYTQTDTIRQILTQAKAYPQFRFEGFYTHPGQTYDVAGPRQVTEQLEQTRRRMLQLKNEFVADYPRLQLSVGDTPGSSLAEEFSGINSLRPGNFVYYDLVMQRLGACTYQDIAICLAAPVVEVQPDRNRLIVHAGWIQLAKDSLPTADDNLSYGQVVPLLPEGWGEPISGAWVVKVSQEHGVVQVPAEQLKQFGVGDLLGILPVHACATAFMMGQATTLQGELITMMPRTVQS